jgi:hypothetical protein
MAAVSMEAQILEKVIGLHWDKTFFGIIRLIIELQRRAKRFGPIVAYKVFGPPYTRLGTVHVSDFAQGYMIFVEECRAALKRHQSVAGPLPARLKAEVSH